MAAAARPAPGRAQAILLSYEELQVENSALKTENGELKAQLTMLNTKFDQLAEMFVKQSTQQQQLINALQETVEDLQAEAKKQCCLVWLVKKVLCC